MRMNRALTLLALALLLAMLVVPSMVKAVIAFSPFSGHCQSATHPLRVIKHKPKKPIQPDPPSDWPVPDA